MIPGKYHRYIVIVILYLIVCTSITSCSAIFPKIHNSLIPQVHSESSALVIGCAILHYGFAKHRPDLVALKYKKGEDSKRLRTIFVLTDSLGYFALSNMPNGYYALHGVQFTPGGNWYYKSEYGDVWGVKRPHVYDGESYVGVSILPGPSEPISWPTPKCGNIHDLGYTVLVDDVRNSLFYSIRRAHHYSTLQSLDAEEIQTGFRSSVPQYFIEKYSQSEWVQYLERIIP